jgi:hypothetical protein
MSITIDGLTQLSEWKNVVRSLLDTLLAIDNGSLVILTDEEIKEERRRMTLASSLTNSLSQQWPIDIINIIVLYARSRSLIVCGIPPRVKVDSVESCPTMIINPFAALNGYACEWQSLPSFTKKGVIDWEWQCNNELVLCMSQDYIDETVTLPYHIIGNHTHTKPNTINHNIDTDGDEVKTTTVTATTSLTSLTKPLTRAHGRDDLKTDGISCVIFGNEWKHSVSSFKFPRYGMTSLCYNNIIYQFGGIEASFLDRRTNIHNDEWKILPKDESESGRWMASCVQWRHFIYTIGGDEAKNRLEGEGNRISCLDTITNTWITIPNGGMNRGYSPLLINIGNDIGVLVMLGSENKSQSIIELYEPHHNHRWSILTLTLPFELPEYSDARFYHWNQGGIYIDDGIICVKDVSTEDHIWTIDIGRTADDVRSLTKDKWLRLASYPSSTKPVDMRLYVV